MLLDDSQGHYMTVKLIDAHPQRGNSPPDMPAHPPSPTAVIERRSDECVRIFSRRGLFLGRASHFSITRRQMPRGRDKWCKMGQRRLTES